MKKIIKVYRRDWTHIIISLISFIVGFINLLILAVKYADKIPNEWVLPFFVLVSGTFGCAFWFTASLHKEPYNMIVEDITEKKQKVIYKRIKE